MIYNREKLIKIIDFWHSSLERGELFVRDAFDLVDYDSKEIVDIVGPRRSGKSSLFKLIIRQMNLRNNFLYINFEDPFFIENNEPAIIEELIEVYQEYFDGELKYLFFDEIQEINHWEKVVRKLRDAEQYKIFITGSSSKLLSREMASSITGRHRTTQMFPLSFAEYLSFAGVDASTKKDIVLNATLIYKKFDEYMEFGGFPEVVITKNKELLKDYFYDFLQKDIVVRHKVRAATTLEKMAVFLMSKSAKIISTASLEKTFNLSYDTVVNYREYLKEAFLLFELSQFSFSLKAQNKALTKNYSIDMGLARQVSFALSRDDGRILENIIFLQLLRTAERVFYYKTANNLEVDFLTRYQNANSALIQVCWDLRDDKTKKREFRALIEAMSELDMDKGTIITYEEEYIEEVNGKEIKVIPAWKWLLEQ